MEGLDHRFVRCATQSVRSMTIRLALLLCTGVMLSCTSSADAMPSLQRGRIILIRGNPGEPLHLPARVEELSGRWVRVVPLHGFAPGKEGELWFNLDVLDQVIIQ